MRIVILLLVTLTVTPSVHPMLQKLQEAGHYLCYRDRSCPSLDHATYRSCISCLEKINADNIEDFDGEGFTVLHRAVIAGANSVVDVLLRRGAHIEAPVDSKHRYHAGKTPLCMAIAHGQLACLWLLLMRGALVISIKDGKPFSLVHHLLWGRESHGAERTITEFGNWTSAVIRAGKYPNQEEAWGWRWFDNFMQRLPVEHRY